MESMPAVLLTGSIVARIIVSVQRGQSEPLIAPPPARKPKKSILMRLPPPDGGASEAGGECEGGETAIGVPSGLSTGVPRTLTSELLQLAGGIPGSEVNCQQEVKPRIKMKNPMLASIRTPQNIITAAEGLCNLGNLMFLMKFMMLSIDQVSFIYIISRPRRSMPSLAQ